MIATTYLLSRIAGLVGFFGVLWFVICRIRIISWHRLWKDGLYDPMDPSRQVTRSRGQMLRNTMSTVFGGEVAFMERTQKIGLWIVVVAGVVALIGLAIG